jgi:hypothetical protein
MAIDLIFPTKTNPSLKPQKPITHNKIQISLIGVINLIYILQNKKNKQQFIANSTLKSHECYPKIPNTVVKHKNKTISIKS